MHIFTELWEMYGSNKLSYETVRRWRNNFLTGTYTEFIKDSAKFGQSVTVKGDANFQKSGKYTLRNIAKAVCISLSYEKR